MCGFLACVLTLESIVRTGSSGIRAPCCTAIESMRSQVMTMQAGYHLAVERRSIHACGSSGKYFRAALSTRRSLRW